MLLLFLVISLPPQGKVLAGSHQSVSVCWSPTPAPHNTSLKRLPTCSEVDAKYFLLNCFLWLSRVRQEWSGD